MSEGPGRPGSPLGEPPDHLRDDAEQERAFVPDVSDTVGERTAVAVLQEQLEAADRSGEPRGGERRGGAPDLVRDAAKRCHVVGSRGHLE